MKQRIMGAAVAALMAGTVPAAAQEAGTLSFGTGLKELLAPTNTMPPPWGAGLRHAVPVPAPIPSGAIAVPGAMPVPEGFTYYLRADLGWGFDGDRSRSETGRLYGTDGGNFVAVTPLTSSGLTGGREATHDGVLIGSVGAGIYLTPRLRADITADFRGTQDFDSQGTYSYASGGGTTTGVVRDQFSVRNWVGLANLYFDILPRGAFTPYIGAGIGFAYNDVRRTYTETATNSVAGTLSVTGSSQDGVVALAGALMAGASFSWHHGWVLDVGYRALYLGEVDISTPLTGGRTSKATLGDQWEHQGRVGLRLNLW